MQVPFGGIAFRPFVTLFHSASLPFARRGAQSATFLASARRRRRRRDTRNRTGCIPVHPSAPRRPTRRQPPAPHGSTGFAQLADRLQSRADLVIGARRNAVREEPNRAANSSDDGKELLHDLIPVSTCGRRGGGARIIAKSLHAGESIARSDAQVALNSSRPINIRRISLVPAPISYSFASRTRRPVGKSLM